MSAKLKPRKMWAFADSSGEWMSVCRKRNKRADKNFAATDAARVLVIPLTAECVEALECKAWNASCASEFAIKKILAAIGIRAPKKGRK